MLITGASNSGSSNKANADLSLLDQMKKFFASGQQASSEPKDMWADDSAEPAPEPTKSLSDFAALFEPAPVDPNAKQEAEPVDPFSHLTKEAIGKAAGNLDFSQAVPEELMVKALSGDAGAMRQAMNGVVQAAFVEMMAGSNTIADKRIQFAMQNQADKLIKQRLADHAMDQAISTNPYLSDPATKPSRDALTASIRTANPKITPTELNTQMADYLQAFAQSISGKASTAKAPPGTKQRVSPEEDAFDF